MQEKLFLILKSIYFLIPSFIRSQYIDTKELYHHIFWRVGKKLRKIFSKKLTLVNTIENLKVNYNILYSKTNKLPTKVNPSKIIADNFEYLKKELIISAPDSFVYEIESVNVIADTNALFVNNNLLSHELSVTEKFHLLKRPDIFQELEKELYVVRTNVSNNNASDISKIYISLLCEASYNYWHWTLEVLTKLILINDVIGDKIKTSPSKYILLVEKRVPEQLIESISYILKLKIDIKFLEPGERFYCKKLIYSPSLSLTLDNAINTPRPEKDFYVDFLTTKTLRDTVLNNITYKNTNNFSKKVYLYRKYHTNYRPINNQGGLNYLLHKLNFDFVDATTLTFSEQIELFSQVDLVVGMVGAGFTNMLYMKENTKVIMLAPATSGASYHIFQHIADVAKVDLTYFLTAPDHPDNIHSSSTVNIKYFKKLLSELENV